jgi:hypothetical protein
MNKNNYNYTLNGISHEICLQSNIKIRVQPHHEKTLISNKYMIKFMNDLFEHHNIDYFLCGHSLLGHKLFEGVHLFSDKMELGIIKNNLVKLKKCEQFLIDNDFQIYFFEHFVIVETIFFENSKSYVIIYLINDDKQLFLKNEKNDIYLFDFYDIFPIKQIKYEEFTSYVPNKINNVLKIFQFQLKTIVFKKLYFVNYDFLLEPIKKQLGVQDEESNKHTKPKEEIITWEQKKTKLKNADLTAEEEDNDDDDDSECSDEEYVNNIQQVLEMDNIIHKVIHEQKINLEKESEISKKETELIESSESHENTKQKHDVSSYTYSPIDKEKEIKKENNSKEQATHEEQIRQEVEYSIKIETEIFTEDYLNETLKVTTNEENDHYGESSFHPIIKENITDDERKQIIHTILFTCCYYFYLPKPK